MQERCPRCAVTLVRIRIGLTSLLECESCAGTWLDASTFEQVCDSRETRACVLHLQPPAAAPVTRRPRRRSAPVYGPCPQCGKLMNRINFGRISGVVVDVCRGHGTFFDRGELHALVRFIEDGGLQRSRRQQLEAISEERRRLEAAERHHFSPYGRRDVVSHWDATAVATIVRALSE